MTKETLMVKRKLNFILKSKSTSEVPAWIGDLVQVLVKLQIQEWEIVRY